MPTIDATSVSISIPLTQGRITWLSVQDADLLALRWQLHKTAWGEYARLNRAGRFYMHRIILARILGRELARLERVDHIDLDGLNNRRENLRLATDATNGQNRGKNKNNSSGYKGVSFSKTAKKKKWIAQIDANGKHYCLGYFDTPELAYEAYCAAALELHGEFARLE